MRNLGYESARTGEMGRSTDAPPIIA